MAKRTNKTSSNTPKPAATPATPKPRKLTVDTKTADAIEEIDRKFKKSARSATDLKVIAEEMSDVWGDFSIALTESLKIFDDLEKPAKSVKSVFDDIQASAKQVYANLEDIGEQYYEHVDVSMQIAEAQKKRNAIEKLGHKSIVNTLDEQIKQLEAIGDAAKMMNVAHDRAIAKGISIREITQDIVDPMKDLMSTVSKFPGGGVLTKVLGVDGKLEKIQKKVMQSFVKNLDETGSVGKSVFKAMGTGAGQFAKMLGPVVGLLAAISAGVMLVQRKFKLDQESTELARNLGISREESGKMIGNLKMMSVTTKLGFALKQDFVEAQKTLSAIASTNAEINQTALESQIRLVKQYGMQNEEAAQFQTIAAGTNLQTDQLTNLVREMTDDYNQLTGDSLNHQEIVKDIAKISGKQLAAYKGNVKQLTLATIQAKRLGMTLEDTAAVSKSLLNFEESIGNEMKANVLSGKSLNMNRARGLALQGKSAEASAEALSVIGEEYGNFQNFLDENIITQEAVAAAAGMTVDQLVKANQIKKINEQLTGREIKDLSELNAQERERLVNKGLLSQADATAFEQAEAQVSIQEQMAKIMDRISSFMDSIVENSTMFSIILGIIAGLAAAFAGSMIIAAVASMSTMSAITLGLSALAIAGATAYMVNSMMSSVEEVKSKTKPEANVKKPATKSIADGEIAPDGGLVVSGKKGTYKLHRDDTVLAGPGLASSKSVEQRGLFNINVDSGGPSMEKVEQLLTKLIQKIDQPVNIQIGTRVIDTLDKAISVRRTYSTSVDKGYGAFG